MPRPTAVTLTLLALMLPIAGGPARAAAIPAWAKPVVESARNGPPPEPGWTWRVLLEEMTITVGPDGTVRGRRREAREILSTDVDRDTVVVTLDARTRVERLRAWHVPPSRRRARRSKGEDVIDISVSDSFLNRSRTRVLPIHDLEKGSIVLVEVVTEEQPLQLGWLRSFGDVVPTRVARVVLEVPEGFGVQSEWLRRQGPEPRRTDHGYVWEWTDLPGLRSEPYAPSVRERLPLLAISVTGDVAGRETTAFGSWGDLGAWASRLVAEQQAERGPLAAWADTTGDPLGAFEAEARKVRDEIRYVSIYLGVNGWKPRAIGETLGSGWGDCKDKAALLTAMLDGAGIRAWPVAVHLSARDTVPSRVPSLRAFNHMIVAVAAGDLPLDEERYGGALGDGGALGPLLFFDPTDDYVPVGQLSAALAGKRALVLAGEQSRLVTLPGDDARWHVREGTLEGRLAANGSFGVDWEGRYRGEPAHIEWSSLRGSSRAQRKDLERFWHEIWPRAGEMTYEGRMDEQAGEFVESASLAVRPPALGERRELPLLPMPRWWLPHPQISSRRRADVLFRYPRTLRLHALWHGLDESWTLPPDLSRAIDGAHVRATTRRRDDGTVEVDVEIVLERRSFGTEELRGLRRLLATCRSIERLSAHRRIQTNTPGSSSPSDE